jgi:8-oxo-dGTP pyrophosphatase MutT (NUDIX family)
MESQYLHEIAITAIIRRGNTFLITKRSPEKKRFPGYWTVPGGRLETKDYIHLDKETKDYWYNVLERTLEREVKEEVGLKIKNVNYLTSLATLHSGHDPSLVISCTATYASGKVKLQKEEAVDFAWVSLKEAKKYQLIDGIYDEIVMASKIRRGRKRMWKRI